MNKLLSWDVCSKDVVQFLVYFVGWRLDLVIISQRGFSTFVGLDITVQAT